MHNIIIKKIWEDEGLIELKVEAICDYARAWQNCYIQNEDYLKLVDKIQIYNVNNEGTYLEFGSKEGNYTPAFSLEIKAPDNFGHVTIEVDLEIDDNDSRKHRSVFYVQTELGCVERFGRQLYQIINNELQEASLNLL